MGGGVMSMLRAHPLPLGVVGGVQAIRCPGIHLDVNSISQVCTGSLVSMLSHSLGPIAAQDPR